MIDLKPILRAHAARQVERAPYEAKWAEIAPFLRPIRDEFHGAVSPDGLAGIESYDGAAAVAADDAGSTIWSMLTSTENIWAPVEYDDPRLRNDNAAQRVMAEANHVLFASLDPAVSSFYAESPETVIDCLTFGNGAFYSARPPGADGFVDQSLSLAECYAAVDQRGRLAAFDRRFTMPLWEMAREFPQLRDDPNFVSRLNRNETEREPILHTVFVDDPDPARRIGNRRIVSLYIQPDKSRLLRQSGYDEMPFFFPGWMRRGAEAYSRGRGEFALPDARMTSEARRTTLVQAGRAAEPPLAAFDEVGEIVTLEPNAVNYGALSERGDQLVKPIQLYGNLQVSLEMQDQARQAVRDALYHTMLSMIASPTPSAVEILKRDEKQQQSMGPALGRVMQQFFAPFILRRFAMLQRAGQLPDFPEATQGAGLRVRFVSPLAKAHRSQKANSVITFLQAAGEVEKVKPGAVDRIDEDRALEHIRDGLSAPPDLLRSEDETAAIRARRQQQVDAAATAQTAETGARAAQSLALAQQAASK